MASILPYLDFPHTLSIQSGTKSGLGGDWTTDGSDPTTVNCYISGRGGEFEVSPGRVIRYRLKVHIGGTGTTGVNLVDDQASTGYRCDLPAAFSSYGQHQKLKAAFVKPVSDEDGIHHEVVFFE